MNEQNLVSGLLWNRISGFFATAALLIGITGLSGWFIGAEELKSFLSDGTTMKVNTALIIIISSLSLLFMDYSNSWVAKTLSLIVILINILIISEHIFQSDLKIDQLFFPDYHTDPTKEVPGRTSVLTAIYALLLAMSLLLRAIKSYTSAQLLAVITLMLLYASLLGHIFGIRGLYQLGFYSGIAFNTALALLLLSLAIIFYDPAKGWMALLNKKLFRHRIYIYLLNYFLCVIPLLIALYLFITGRVNFSKASNLLVLLIITALIVIPIAYLLLSRLNRMDADLKKSNEQLTIALQASGMGVWAMDIQSDTITQSEKLTELFGKHYETAISSKLFFEQFFAEDRERVEQAFINATQTGILDIQSRILLTNKQFRWIQIYGKTIYDDIKKPERILGTMMDISEDKELQRHKDDFISTVSHELKTPITSIKAHIQILERKFSKAGDQGTAIMLQRINVQMNRLNTLIRDMLEVGRIEADKISIRKEAYSFKDLVEETVAEIEKTTVTHQLIVTENPDLYCFGDRERTYQVLSNLLTNAIKYSPDKNQVLIKVVDSNEQIICSVQDFGMGITAEKQAHVFERFYRASDQKTNSMISGFGLGLYISSEIIKRLNGKIWFLSSPAAGSTFYFSLPKQL